MAIIENEQGGTGDSRNNDCAQHWAETCQKCLLDRFIYINTLQTYSIYIFLGGGGRLQTKDTLSS